MDPQGKLRRIPKSVPVFKTVAQVGDTTRRRTFLDDLNSDSENASPLEKTSNKSKEDYEFSEYEFLDEAFEHPEGLGFQNAQAQREATMSQVNDMQASCSSCELSAQKQESYTR